MNDKKDRSVSNLVACWEIKLKNGQRYGFTQADDLIIEDKKYYACAGFDRSAIEMDSFFSADNLTIDGIIDHHHIKHEDLISGLFDYAEVNIFLIDLLADPAVKIHPRTGWFGEVKVGGGNFTVEIRGLMESFTQKIGELYSPQCRAQLGDKRCKFDSASLTYCDGIVTKVTHENEFFGSNIKEQDNYFKHGKIKFLSGRNEDLEVEIFAQIGDKITLICEPPYKLSVGDDYQMTPGCGGSIETCISKFNNAVNFRGEPYLQRVNKYLF